jgi:DNA-directed RNA polymerase specialized sigma24 family protein
VDSASSQAGPGLRFSRSDDGAAALRRYGRAVALLSPPSESTIARVFGAAVAAAADRRAAEEATLRVFAAEGRGETDADRLAATAVCLAVRAAPAPAFAAMAPPDAEAVALARLLGLKEGGIAAVLGVDTPEIRLRLKRGLTARLDAAARV